MKSKSVKVSKIVINIGGQDIPLTVEQARELQEALAETLGGRTEHHYHYPERPDYRPWRYWTVLDSTRTTAGSSVKDWGGAADYLSAVSTNVVTYSLNADEGNGNGN